MNVFFDTEFTQFRDAKLLSIGFVTDDDRELCIEVHDRNRWQEASDFCRSSVIPQFGLLPSQRASTDREVGQLVADWFSSLPPTLTLAYDYKTDWRLLESCLWASGHWPTLSATVQPMNVADYANSEACLAAQESHFEGLGAPGRHHALVDARALRARWQKYLEQTRGA